MYRVGQILYTILDSKHAIFPVKVVEEVTVKNLESEKTNYKVLLPNSKEQKVDLDRFDKVIQAVREDKDLDVGQQKSDALDLVAEHGNFGCYIKNSNKKLKEVLDD